MRKGYVNVGMDDSGVNSPPRAVTTVKIESRNECKNEWGNVSVLGM